MGSCLGSNSRAWCWELGWGEMCPVFPYPGLLWGTEGGVPSDMMPLSGKSICLRLFFAGRFSTNDSCMAYNIHQIRIIYRKLCLPFFLQVIPNAFYFTYVSWWCLSTLPSRMAFSSWSQRAFSPWPAVWGQWNVSSWSSPDPHHAGIMISSFTLRNCENSTAVFVCCPACAWLRQYWWFSFCSSDTCWDAQHHPPSPAAEHTQVHSQLLPDGSKLSSTVTLDDQTNTKTSTLIAKWTGLGREGRQIRERPLQTSVREESYRGSEQQ